MINERVWRQRSKAFFSFFSFSEDTEPLAESGAAADTGDAAVGNASEDCGVPCVEEWVCGCAMARNGELPGVLCMVYEYLPSLCCVSVAPLLIPLCPCRVLALRRCSGGTAVCRCAVENGGLMDTETLQAESCRWLCLFMGQRSVAVLRADNIRLFENRARSPKPLHPRLRHPRPHPRRRPHSLFLSLHLSLAIADPSSRRIR